MTFRKPTMIAAITLVAASLAVPANADPKGKGKGHKGPPPHAAAAQGAKSGGDDALIDVDINFNSDQRNGVYSYYQGASCPPGLAKKNNGCLPPGQAKKRYEVGQAVPDGVTIYDVPGDIYDRIGRPPAGYYYGYVDGDLLMLANATNRVVDAIVAVNAASNALSD